MHHIHSLTSFVRTRAWLSIAALGACGGAPTPRGSPSSAGGAPAGPGSARLGDGAPPRTPATGSADGDALLAAHNRFRAAHCTPPLSWSDELARVAQGWADTLRDRGCAFEHNRTGYGENLAAGSTGYIDADAAVTMWYREVDLYDFARPGFAMDTGHFTQVIWRGSTHVGCGRSECDGMTTWVCNYDPPGNWEGAFPANVPPAC